MGDGANDPSSGPFEVLDSKLTVFALANGMDLAKGESYRRLEWFKERLERGILIEPAPAGGFAVSALSWRTGRAEDRARADVAEGVSAKEIGGVLESAIEAANDLKIPDAEE